MRHVSIRLTTPRYPNGIVVRDPARYNDTYDLHLRSDYDKALAICIGAVYSNVERIEIIDAKRGKVTIEPSGFFTPDFEFVEAKFRTMVNDGLD